MISSTLGGQKWTCNLIAHCFNPVENFTFEVDVKKGYVNELIILSNSMYGRIGKSEKKEKMHSVTQIIIHPLFVSNSKW